ncbi:di-heme oxidoreductase family protein [Salisaeta longa]|uniref:di-heme oxidoreductase family protein n=1 Tax=Salisaeta longa TaxID=503170 RepID=UPI000400B355|nr:di-heme oxidoredictase family protein [Salisaeta longa]
MRQDIRHIGLLFLVLSLAACDVQQPPKRNSNGVDVGARLGGDATVFEESRLSFAQPIPGLSPDATRRHDAGDRAFEDVFVTAPAAVNGGLGPAFVQPSCDACHARDGRTPGEVLMRLSTPGTGPHGGARPADGFGTQLQTRALYGYPVEGRLAVQQQTIRGEMADGTPYTLTKPVYTIESPYGPLPANLLTSVRAPRPVFGLGLLEAVPDATLRELAATQQAAANGISGEVNMVWNMETKTKDIGRFGWKATQPTLLQQSADAYIHDMGVTSSLFPNELTDDQPGFDDGLSDEPEITDETLDDVTFYVQTLAVPARRNIDDPAVQQGARLFEQIGCATCHRPTLRTGTLEGVPSVSNQTIHPFTDMLLHDMGPDLADGRPVFDASGQEWRTPPLWGIGLTDLVNGRAEYLHDGRAETLQEAILWHGGEARAAQQAYTRLSKDERDAVLAFLRSL